MHKKFTYKDGKKYGPYLYENKRVGEHVVTKYVGKQGPFSGINKRNILLYFLIFIGAILFILSMNLDNSSPTGKVALDVDEVRYHAGEPVSGIIKFNLKEGEFIPSDSTVRVILDSEVREYSLKDLVETKESDGNYYAEDSSISGMGRGYGFVGKKSTTPDIEFELSIVDANGEEKIVSGKVSKGNDFVYNEEYASYSIVPESVKLLGDSVDFSAVSSEDNKDEIRITTNYELIEEGYGEEYLGDYTNTLDIEVDGFNLTAIDDALRVELIYNGEIIASAEKDIILENFENESDSDGDDSALINQKKNIPNIKIPYQKSVTIELSNYFSGAETYSFQSSGISATIEGGVLVLTSDDDFKGIRQAKIIASNGNEILESNTFEIIVSSRNVNIKTERSEIKVGEPVTWTKNIHLDTPEEISVEVPVEAENIVVKSVEGGVEEEVTSTTSSFTGNVVIEIDLKEKEEPEKKEESFISRFFKNMFDTITGNAVAEININDVVPSEEIKEVTITDSSTEYVIEYQTPAPEAFEKESDFGKTVVISAPDDLGYTDVLSFADVDEVYTLSQKNEIKIYWVEEKTYVDFDAYDLNVNGMIDYVEWITPHLSNQTFEIILISKASHLDFNKEVVADIYQEVSALDGNYYTIPVGDYARITFERELDSGNDITLHARSSGNAQVEVYEKDDGTLLMTFDVSQDGEYKKFLTNLVGQQDTFDLLVKNADVDFDLIIDPTPSQTSSGPNVFDSYSDFGSGDVLWENIGYLFGEDGNYASLNFTGIGQISNGVYVNDFGFSIPLGSTINGVMVEVLQDGIDTNVGTGDLIPGSVVLVDDDGVEGIDQCNILPGDPCNNWDTSGSYVSYGNSSTNWGFALTPEIVNDVDFGFKMYDLQSGTSLIVGIDNIRMTVYYTPNDTLAPYVNITLPLATTYTSLPIPVNVTLDEPGSRVIYTLDDGITNTTLSSTNNLNYNVSITSLASGSYTLRIYANDTNGNRNYTQTIVFDYIETNLNGCANISVSNTIYTLQNDINDYVGNCFNITANNVILNGNGYTLNGDYSGTDYGIYTSGRTNVTIVNFRNISGFHYGISFATTNFSKVNNVSLYGNLDSGISLFASSNNSLSNISAHYNAARGVYLGVNASYNVVSNVIANNNSGGSAYGLFLSGTSNRNVFNNITANHNGNRGIQLTGYATNNTFYNIIINNNLVYGLILTSGSDNNEFYNVTASNTSMLYGIFLSGASNITLSGFSITHNNVSGLDIAGSSNNNISHGTIGYSNFNQLTLMSPTAFNNTFTNISFVGTDARFNDLFFNGVSANGSVFIDMPNIGNYSFNNSDGLITFRRSSLGEVKFLQPVNGTGNNFTRDVYISNRSVFINATLAGLNKSANISLYGYPAAGLSSPTIFKNGVICADCYNFTNLTASTVIFNVSTAGNYTIGDLTKLTACGILDRNNTVYTLQNDITTTETCFLIWASNLTLDGNGYALDSDDSGDYGIITDYYPNITIKNFRNISDFSNGIRFVAPWGSISNINASSNSAAIAVVLSNNVTVDNIIAFGDTGGSTAIDLTSSTNILVSNLTTTGDGYGLMLTSATSNVTVVNAMITNKSRGIFYFGGGSKNLILRNVTLANNTYSIYGGSTSVRNVYLNDSFVDTYLLVNAFNATFINSTAGAIDFIGGFNGTGNNLFSNSTSSIVIRNNSAYINLTFLASTSVNISLYNYPSGGLFFPAIMKNGVACTDCYNSTPLNASTVMFNISSSGNYSLGESLDINITSCTNMSVANGYYRLLSDISTTATNCLRIRADNITLDGNGYTFDGDDGAFDVGIRNDQGYNNITIKHFRNITDFYYGIYFYNSSYNTLYNLTLSSNTDDAIYFYGNALSSRRSNGNNFTSLRIVGNTNYGLTLIRVNASEIRNVNSTGNRAGLSLDTNSENNIFINYVASTNQYGLIFQPSSSLNAVNNTFINSSFSSSTQTDMYNPFGSMQDTRFVDTKVGNYSALSNSRVYFINTSLGEVSLFGGLNASGYNLFGNSSADIVIGNSSVITNSGKINKSMNVTLYGVNTTLSYPVILRNSIVCTDCYNFTSLNSGTVIFNASGGGNFTVMEDFTRVNACGTLNVANSIYNLQQNIDAPFGDCFTITADNITLDGNGYLIDGADGGDGISMNGRNNITIKNFENITGFNEGISMINTQNSTIINMSIIANTQNGIYMQGSTNNNLSDLIVSNNQENGISLTDYCHYTALNNISVISNSFSGISSLNSNSLVLNNIIGLYNAQNGIHLDSGNSQTLRSINVSNNNYAGLSLLYTIYSNISGISATSNSNAGIKLDYSTSINIESASSNLNLYGVDNTASSSTVLRNFTALGNSESINSASMTISNLIYENTYGNVSYDLANVLGNLTFPGYVVLANNSFYIDGTSVSELNISANVTLTGLPNLGTNVAILKDGYICTDCLNYSALDDSNVVFGINEAGNYSINETYDILSCTSITKAGNYTLMNNLTASGDCIVVRSDNVTILGQGYTIHGNISADNLTGGDAFKGLLLRDIIVNGTVHASSFLYLGYIDAGDGGTITIINSTAGKVIALGTDFNQIYAGNGGNVTLINSTVGLINVSGGGGMGGFAGDGGMINLINSTALNLFAVGGSAGAQETAGDGGTIRISDDVVDLTNYKISVSNGSLSSVQATPGIAGLLVINYTDNFVEGGSSSYGPALRINLIRQSYGAINWGNKPYSGLGIAEDSRLSYCTDINNNSVVFTDTCNDFNYPANLTLYDIGDRGYIRPVIINNGSVCSDCYNFTSLNASTVIFNVSGNGNYSIGEDPTLLTTCGVLYIENAVYTLQNDISGYSGTCFTIDANNITLNGNGYAIDGDGTGNGIYINSVTRASVANFSNINDFDTGISSASGNSFRNINISSSISYGISNAFSSHNNFENMVLLNNGRGIYQYQTNNNTYINVVSLNSSVNDLFSLDAPGNHNIFVNSRVDNYSIASNSVLTFTNTNYASIKFLTGITSSGNNLIINSSSNIVLGNNSVYFNSLVFGINRSANITLYGLSTTMTNPFIIRDGTICSSCRNLTSLNAGTVIFNVSSGGNYSVRDLGTLTECQVLDIENNIYTLANDIVGVSGTCFNITASNVTLNGNGHTVSSGGSPSSRGIYAYNVSRITIKNIEVNFFTNGIYMHNVSSSLIQGNTIQQSTDNGINAISSYNNNLSGNYLTENADYQLVINTGSYGNTMLNNSFNNSAASWSILDLSGNSLNNYLVYNNSYGQIKWTNPLFTRNLTTRNNVTFGGSVFIRYNSAGINPSAFTPIGLSRIDSSANITIYNAPAYAGNYKQALFGIKGLNGFRCTNCYNFTNLLSGGYQFFNVTNIGANYSIGLAPRSKSHIPLGKGWNLFGIMTDDNYTEGSNVTITLRPGRNYIGYSSAVNITRGNITATLSNGTVLTWNDIIRLFKGYNQFAYFEGDSNVKKFKYAPLDDDRLRQEKGYIVDVNEDQVSDYMNLTFVGSGGSLTNDTYAWSDLMFMNETSGEVLNITQAASSGWIQGTIQLRSAGSDEVYATICGSDLICDRTYLSSWEGIQINSYSDDIVILRQD